MPDTRVFSSATFMRDVTASLVVFLVALPLCLGVALASGAPLFAGLLAGIVGGVVVGVLSGSHVSVSGPAAGMTSIVAAQIVSLGSFEVFLLAVVVAGAIQIVLGLGAGRLHRRIFSLERRQRVVGGNRRHLDPETDSSPART